MHSHIWTPEQLGLFFLGPAIVMTIYPAGLLRGCEQNVEQSRVSPAEAVHGQLTPRCAREPVKRNRTTSLTHSGLQTQNEPSEITKTKEPTYRLTDNNN